MANTGGIVTGHWDSWGTHGLFLSLSLQNHPAWPHSVPPHGGEATWCPLPLPHSAVDFFFSGLLKNAGRCVHTHIFFNLILSSLLLGYSIHKLLKSVTMFTLFCLYFYAIDIKDVKIGLAVHPIQ